MDKIEVTQADIELRKAILKCIVDGLDRACTDGDMIDDRTGNLDRIIAAHRLATRTDATPVAWMYERKPDAWPAAPNVIVEVGKRWADDDTARPFWTEHYLYTHPPATDVAALVEAAYREGWDDGRSYLNTEDNGWSNSNARQALTPFTKGQNDE